MPTTIIFRPSNGTPSIYPGAAQSVGGLDVSTYSQIRVAVRSRSSNTSTITVQIQFCDAVNTPVTGYLDEFTVAIGATVTNVYAVPGTYLTFALIASKSNSPLLQNVLDFYVYG